MRRSFPGRWFGLPAIVYVHTVQWTRRLQIALALYFFRTFNGHGAVMIFTVASWLSYAAVLLAIKSTTIKGKRVLP